jgi:16S rRNA processing protein RimM
VHINSDDFVAVARIGRPFGLKGACALFPIGETLLNSDLPTKLWIGNEGEEARKITLSSIDGENNALRCMFGGVFDRDEADKLKNLFLYIEKERLPELEEGEFYFRDLLGLSVESESGEAIGTVKEIFNYPTTDAFDVRLINGRTITIPFKEEIVKEVVVGEGKIIVDSVLINELML